MASGIHVIMYLICTLQKTGPLDEENRCERTLNTILHYFKCPFKCWTIYCKVLSVVKCMVNIFNKRLAAFKWSVPRTKYYVYLFHSHIFSFVLCIVLLYLLRSFISSIVVRCCCTTLVWMRMMKENLRLFWCGFNLGTKAKFCFMEKEHEGYSTHNSFMCLTTFSHL